MSSKQMFTCIGMLMVACALVAPGAISQSGDKAEVLLEAAQHKQLVDGDLEAAIRDYKTILAEFASNHPVAARALVKMGECYEKLGQSEAQKAYERVLRDYADQSAEATEARTRLSALEHSGAHGTELVTRRIWAGPDVDPEGSPSPDGRLLSYVNRETNNVAIYDVATGKKRDVTHHDPKSGGFAMYAKLSPDGKRVAYLLGTEEGDVHLCVVGVDGSEPRIFYSNKELEWVTLAGWSPDGRTILALFQRKDRTYQVALVSMADGSARILKTLDYPWSDMTFSPDGRYIAYDSPPKQDPHKYDIYVLAVDGSRENPLVQSPADNLLLGWAPDGKSVLFASDRTGSMSAWAIRVTDGKPQGSPQLIKTDIGQSFPMGFTRDGSFYYGVIPSTRDVYLAPLDPTTGMLLNQPSPLGQHPMGLVPQAEFSPDGKELAYYAVKIRPPTGDSVITLYIRSLATGEEREFSPAIQALGNPHWSPDGRSILFSGWRTRDHGLYEINVQSGAVEPIVLADPGTYSGGGVWTSGGKSIFYWHNVFAEKSSRIVLHHMVTGREEVVYRSPSGVWVTNIARSPDGQQLALTTSDVTDTEQVLWVMSTAGGEARDLHRFTKSEVVPFQGGLVWPPNGRYLLFATVNGKARGQQTTELWRISPEGGQPEKLGVLARGGFPSPGGLRVSPDGRQIAFIAGQWKEEVWVMQNFLPTLRAAK